MIERSNRQVTLECDTCREMDVLHPTSPDQVTEWLRANGWKRDRFLTCPYCVSAREERRAA